MVQTLKKDNKGFTLVELLVVVAILGILAVVLVPQYIQYVEKSRLATDQAQIEEVAHAAEVAIAADENVYNEVKAAGATIEIPDSEAITATTNLASELKTIVGTVDFKSKTYDGKTVQIPITVTSGTPTVGAPTIKTGA